MERIALVSDIHSNVHALDVFMNYIDKECKVSQILNMGDFIQIGPNPKDWVINQLGPERLKD